MTTMMAHSMFNNDKTSVTVSKLGLMAMALTGAMLSACSTTPPKTRPVVVKNIPSYYVVQSGDTVGKIASRYGLDYRRIGALNGLDSNYTIYKGQRLRLVANQPTSQPQPTRPVVVTPRPRPTTPTVPTAPNTPIITATPAIPSTTATWLRPVNGNLLRAFNPSAGIMGNWYGASQGTPVVASQAGTVLYVGSDLPEYGKLVMIQHNKDFITAYAHLNNFNVTEKQTVQAGQQIGTVGLLPKVNQPALEFQIRYRGTPINPATYVK